jgi:hypothetical protein
MAGTVMRFGSAPMTSGAAKNRHLVYFHGTDCIGQLDDCDIEGAPGSAIQSYRGSPVITINRGRYVGQYRGAMVASGSWTVTGAELRAAGTAFDVEHVRSLAALTLTGCTGGGANGAVRAYNA